MMCPEANRVENSPPETDSPRGSRVIGAVSRPTPRMSESALSAISPRLAAVLPPSTACANAGPAATRAAKAGTPPCNSNHFFEHPRALWYIITR